MIKTGYLCVLIAVAFAANIVYSAVVWQRLSANDNLSAHEKKLCEAEQALSFASGYLFGQRGIIKGAHLPIAQPKLTSGSIKARAIASRHGFTIADNDDGVPE